MLLHDGFVYDYIVTQTDSEGPEYLMRLDVAHPNYGWQKLDETDDVPAAVFAHFLPLAEMYFPASVRSDLSRVDFAIKYVSEQCDRSNDRHTAWKLAEPIFDALHDARTCITTLASELYTPHSSNKDNSDA